MRPSVQVVRVLDRITAGQTIDCAPCDFPPSSIPWPPLLQVRSQSLVDCWTNKRQCSMQHSVLIVRVLNRSTADRQQFRLDTTSLPFISVTTARAGCYHSPCYGRRRSREGFDLRSQPLYFFTSLIILGFVHFLVVFDLQQLRFGGLDDRGLVDDKILKVVDLSSNFPG